MKTKLFLSLTLAAIGMSGDIHAAPNRKVTVERAREIALGRVGGEIERADTVTRHKKPVYSFFIRKSDGGTAHVLVSEKGRIKRVADETPATAKIK
ncbi:MAG TPA: PepSY domain-containing protein [Pyrinomonadaceae bacterium]|jgi:uncharacterized membrane protein YkoI